MSTPTRIRSDDTDRFFRDILERLDVPLGTVRHGSIRADTSSATPGKVRITWDGVAEMPADEFAALFSAAGIRRT